jgi:hypothetical protein
VTDPISTFKRALYCMADQYAKSAIDDTDRAIGYAARRLADALTDEQRREEASVDTNCQDKDRLDEARQ